MTGLDLSGYWIRTADGTPLIQNTIDKFRSDLGQLVYLHRTTGEITPFLLEQYQMTNLDWTGLVNAKVEEVAGGYGGLDKGTITEVVNWFSKHLNDNVKAWAETEKAAKERAENRRKNVFAAYAELGKEVAPEGLVVSSVIALSGVKPRDIESETEAIQAELETMIEEEILGRLAGPKGGLGLCKDSKGKATAWFKENEQSIVFGRIVRKPKA